MTKFKVGDEVRLSSVGRSVFGEKCASGRIECISTYYEVEWADGTIGLYKDRELVFVSKESQIESWLKDNA